MKTKQRVFSREKDSRHENLDQTLEAEGAPTMAPPPMQLTAGPAASNASDGAEAQAKKGKPRNFVPKHNSDDFESKKEKRKLAKATKQAYRMAKKAKSNVSKDNKTYKTWMDTGESDTENAEQRVSHVKSGMDAITSTLEEDLITFKKYGLDDGQEESTYAYVYPSEEEHNIYLGGAFWVAKIRGWDSKAGTIIHELSHRVHGTDDHAYGRSGAQDLAKNDPNTATKNADNYEYFAEGS